MPESTRKTAKKPKKPTFEQAVERLEEITAALEDGVVSLEDSMELYREGMELTLYCDGILKAVEQEVLLLQKTADGGAELVPFGE